MSTANNNPPDNNNKRKSKLIARLMRPMLLLVLLHLITIIAIFIMTEEFSYNSYFIRVFIIAVTISVLVSIFVIIFTTHAIVKPITSTINTLNNNQDYNQLIRFEPSNIYEIDMMTDAITQLQINVLDYSSQVSKMMRIADIGLGSFMYDHLDNSVYVGQSLLKFMKPQMQLDEDVVLVWQDFLENYVSDETRQIILEGMKAISDGNSADYVKEYSITREDGSLIWARLNMVHTKDKSIAVWQDITDSVIEKQQIEYERDYDPTTGLLNRRAYYRHIVELFHDTDALKTTAFVMIDLDNLKYVNDTYGHDFGDDYIKTAALALKKFQNYGGIVSRLSGDEFNVCLPGFSSKEEVREIIGEIREQLLQSGCLLADGTRYKLSASVGVSWYPDDAITYEQLMKYADFAMYSIKHSTKGGIAEFDIKAYEMDSVQLASTEEMNRIITERSVRHAFHSILSAKTGGLYGYEALLRPQSTMFKSPQELIRAAKTAGKLHDIERMTWTKVLADFQEQIDAGNISKNCHIFISSFPDSAMNPSDADVLEAAYPNLLSSVVLEVSENEWVNGENIARKANRMKKWNAQTALDDFGTGFNSDYALLTLKPDIIKIDSSIISGCDKDQNRSTTISNYVKLAQSKQILVLAKGVETEEELKTVISCGVDLVQGSYVDDPNFEPQQPAPEITAMIRDFA